MNRTHDRHFLVRRLLAVLSVSTWMATCGDPQTRTPTAPSGPAVLTREISGPASVAPGQSAQFTAIVRLGDGITKTLTGVVWRTTNPSVLQVTSAGVAVAGSGMGDVTLQADVPGEKGTVRVSREVVILPDGTYRLVGAVRDAEDPSFTVASARVDATPGSVSATADSFGNYKLYGVPADAEVHITGDGYQPLVTSVHLTGHTTKNFQLTPSGPRPSLVGSYTLSIDAAPGCSGPRSLPDDLQHRRYQATVTQSKTALHVTLTEPRFNILLGLGNHFYGSVAIGGAEFGISGFFSRSYYFGRLYYYYPDVVERLSDGTVLVVGGSVTTTGTAAGLSGQLDGELSHYSAFPDSALLRTVFPNRISSR